MKSNNLLSLFLTTLLFATVSHAQVPGYVPTSGLKAWYGFNGNANDLSGNANNATNSGATFISDRNGNTGAAASFNGTSNYMEVTTPGFTFSPSGAFTYSFWMNKQTQISSAGIVMMSGTNTAGVFITLIQGASNFSFGTNMQQSSWAFTTCLHTLNVWDHYVTTFNAGVMKIYKNSTFQSTATYTHVGATTATIPFMIGRGLGGNSTCFKGALDDIGIWNRELSQAEITALFTSITAIPVLNEDVDVILYPNPSSDVINLKTTAAQIGLNYQIVDAQGRKTGSGKIMSSSESIDIKALPAGVYFIKLGEVNPEKFKFIKKE